MEGRDGRERWKGEMEGRGMKGRDGRKRDERERWKEEG